MLNEGGIPIPWRKYDERLYSADNVIFHNRYQSHDLNPRSFTLRPTYSSSFNANKHSAFEEWKKSAEGSFCDDNLKATESYSSQRSRTFAEDDQIFQNNLIENFNLENDDVTQWDSVSMTSSNHYSLNGHTREMFDGFFQDDGYATPNNWREEEKDPEELDNPSCQQLPYRDPSARLISCINSLDYLSKKLESVTKLSSEVEKFRSASENYLLRDSSKTEISNNNNISRKKRNFSERYKEERQNQNNCDNSSNDSGINIEAGEISALSRYKSFDDGRYRPLFGTNFKHNFDSSKSQTLNESTKRNRLFMSKDYTGIKDFRKRRFSEEYQYHHEYHPSVDHQFLHQHYFDQQNQPLSDYGNIYGSEDPYGYGTFPYASSSIYDEDLYQRNGWFFLPPTADGAYQQSLSTKKENVYNLQENFQSNQFPRFENTASAFSFSENIKPSLSYHSPYSQSQNYGSSSDLFLNPNNNTSVLGEAIIATCAKESMYDILPQKSKAAYITASRCINKEVPLSANHELRENKKKKSVRFSEMVQERFEKSDSEVQDTTSIIKGEVEDKDEKIKNSNCELNSFPEYQKNIDCNYPTNHESGCNCPQCTSLDDTSCV